MNTSSTDQPVPAAPSQKWLDTQQERFRSAPNTTAEPPSFEHPPVVAPEEWLVARRELLRDEKEVMRRCDALALRQRTLPWVKIQKNYCFDSPAGRVSLGDLFGTRRQLIVQHFMFGSGWEEGCKSCSFMSDHINPTVVHLAARDVSFAAVSQAPIAEILSFQQRMGWQINWVSAHGTDFSTDFHVSYSPEAVASGPVEYNYSLQEVPNEELPGISVFAKDLNGDVYHTYSTYGRGVELVMTTYRLLDIVPKGRDEAGLEYGMAWVRHHDHYDHVSAGR